MLEKQIGTNIPGQRIGIFKNQDQLLLGLGIIDQAVHSGKPMMMIQLDKINAANLINDLLETYDELYGECVAPREKSTDSQAI